MARAAEVAASVQISSLRRLAAWIADHELWVLVLAAPFLIFPGGRLLPFTYLALAALPLLWVCRKLTYGAWTVPTPLDGPLVVLVLLTPLAYAISVAPDGAFEKACGLLLGIAIYYGLVNWVRRTTSDKRQTLDSTSTLILWRERVAKLAQPGWLAWASLGLIVAGVGVSLLSLLGTDWWVGGKVAKLDKLYLLLPRVFRDVPNSVRGGFHPNEVAGTLIMLLPVALAVFLLARGRLRWVVALAAGLMGGVLFLTQSRGAWLALGLAVLLFVLLRWPRLRLPVLGVMAVAVVISVVFIVHEIQTPDTASTDTSITRSDLETAILKLDAASRPVTTYEPVGWIVRLEVWRNAVQVLADYPLTGVGLSAFAHIAQTYYVWYEAGPIFLRGMTHAHNIYLQTGMDFGLPGMLAFLILWLLFFRAARRALAAATPTSRILLIGLIVGLVAYLLHGLVDAVTLGAKPGLVLWVMLGLVVAATPQPMAEPVHRRQAQVRVLSLAAAVGFLLIGLVVLQPGQWPWDWVNHNITLLRLDQALLKPGLDNNVRLAPLTAFQPSLAAMAASPAAPPSLSRRLGVVDWLLDQPDQAVVALQQDPQSADYLLNQAVLQSFNYLRPHASLEMFDMAAQLDTKIAHDYCLLANRLQAQGEVNAAGPVYREGLDKGRNDDPVTLGKCYAGLARTLVNSGDWAGAAENYSQAAELVPTNYDYQLNAGLSLYRAQGDYAAAARHLQAAADLDPKAFWPCVMLSEVYRTQNQYDQALTWAQKAVERAPDQTVPLTFEARAYLAKGDAALAEALLRQALGLNPNDGQVHFWLGEALWVQGNKPGAVSEFEQAVNLMPNSAAFVIRLGDAYQDQGRRADALAQYQAALKLDPASTDAQHKLDQLQATP